MSIVEAYVKNLSLFSLYTLEDCIDTWMTANEGVIKNKVLPSLIDEKLKRYEQEY